MPRLAPRSSEASPGSGTARSAGSTVYCAAVPQGHCQAAKYTHTRSPTRAGSTPSPTASTVPAPSWFGTWKRTAGSELGEPPVRDFQSVGFTPDTLTRTRTSPGPGSGVSTSSTRRTSRAGPGRSWIAASMAA